LGLSLCETHRRVKDFTDPQVIYEVVAASSMRRGGGWRLPNLGSVRHILQKSRGRFYELPVIFDMFQSLSRSLNNTWLQREMVRALHERETSWRRELQQVQTKKMNGMVYFEQLKRELRARNLDPVAEALSYSEYKERDGVKLLFVNLDESLRGRLVGKQGVTIKSIEANLGVRIKFERLSR
jgi:hypothetical protein